MKIDLETLQVVKELLTHQHYGEIVPTHSDDKDSFASLTKGLSSNWVIIAFFLSGVWFLFNSLNSIQGSNQFQDTEIKTNIADIAQNKADIHQNALNIQTLNTTQVANYNDIILKLNTLQTTVETLKQKNP